jgi:acylphosphatase
VGRLSRRFRVTGRVQGVYFRQSTRVQAERLALLGHARNLPDGSVEVLAYGEVEQILELERWLHKGPSSARVDRVIEIELEPDTGPAPDAFQVL